MKNLKGLVCLMMVMVLALSASACKRANEAEESVLTEIEYEYVYESQNKTESSTDGNGADHSGASGNNGQSSNKTSSASNGNTSSSANQNAIKERAKKYRGTTVRYATWANPERNEDGPVIKAFEKEYGIDVKIDLIGQGEYLRTIAGYIASGDSPDIYFCNNDFPSCLTCLQPISAAQLDKSDPIWDQDMFNSSTINGKTYLINTVKNVWNEVDCVFYNKRLFKDHNITTPEEYYKQGKWNLDTLTKAMRDVKNIGSDYVGGYLDWETIMGMTGTGFYKWENGKFSNGSNTMLADAARYLATCAKEGLIKGIFNYDLRDEFINGKVGIAITNAFGLKKTGYWGKMNTDNIGFTYLPDWSASQKSAVTGLYRGWGIIKGAKNPVAAGIFLRHYLDADNYDTNDTFINAEAASFFFQLTGKAVGQKKNLSLVSGTYSVTNTPLGTFAYVAKGDPAQVDSRLSSIQNTLNNNVRTLNDFIAQQTK